MKEAPKLLAGKYSVIRTLGKGSFGVVYEGVEVASGRSVAIKRLHAHQAAGEALERFKREARICAHLDNPHIVAVHDFGEDEEGPFLVMELLDGRTLDEWVETSSSRPTDTVILVARQMLSALAAAHHAGVVHRDIKPANVFLVDTPRGVVVKILDFGMAKLRKAAPLTRTGDMVGTIAYMAPEQARAQEVDARTDLYAVGICLYIAFSGKPPFKHASVLETVRAIESGDCKELTFYRRDLPKGLPDVVHKAFAVRPDQRFQSAEEMLEALAAYGPPPTAMTERRDDVPRSSSGSTGMPSVPLAPVFAPAVAAPSRSVRGVVIGVVLAALVFVAAAVALLLALRPAPK